MRVFQVIEGSANNRLPANRTWYHNLYEPLVELGVEVVSFPAEEGRRAMVIRSSYKFSRTAA